MLSDGAGSQLELLFEPTERFETQYRAAMETVAVVNRSHLRRVEATGADRESFLHNMLSADVKRIRDSTGARATLLTVKGKLVSDLIVFKESDRFLLEMEASRVEPLVSALSRYIIAEDVTLRSLEEEEATFSLEGPRASVLVSQITGVSVDELGHLAIKRTPTATVTAHCHEPSPRFDVTASPVEARSLLRRAIDAGAIIAGERLAETRRIEAGRARFGVDMDDSHMPMEAGLDDAISFDKGCYIGQEYVVRLAHRGHLNRKLIGISLKSEREPPIGATIEAAGQPVGQLTSAAYSPGLGRTVALGYVKREFFEPGTDVSVGGDAGQVSSLPFI